MECLLPYVTLEEDEDQKHLIGMKQVREKLEEFSKMLETLAVCDKSGKTEGEEKKWEEIEERAKEFRSYRYSRDALRELSVKFLETAEQKDAESLVALCEKMKAEMH